MRCGFPLAFVAIAAFLPAQNRLPPDIPPFGVQSVWPSDPHLEEYLDLMAEAGIGVGRFDLCWWGMCETEPGIYNFDNAQHEGVGVWDTDRCIRMMRERGIEPYAILCYDNPIHLAEDELFSHEAMEAFGDYCFAAATRYRDEVRIWEIWNEPNLETFWGRARPISAENYAALACVAARRIREANAEAVIVAPALSWITFQPEFEGRWLEYLDVCGQSGLFDLVDAVSIHPYRVDETPESVNEDLARVREVIARHTDRDLGLWCGEWGFKTIWSEVDEATQAAYLQRMVLNNLSQGVDMTIWFSFKDFEGAGLLDEEMNPRPAYEAMRALNTIFPGDVEHLDPGVLNVSFEPDYPEFQLSEYRVSINGLLHDHLRIESFRASDEYVVALWLDVPPGYSPRALDGAFSLTLPAGHMVLSPRRGDFDATAGGPAPSHVTQLNGRARISGARFLTRVPTFVTLRPGEPEYQYRIY